MIVNVFLMVALTLADVDTDDIIVALVCARNMYEDRGLSVKRSPFGKYRFFFIDIS